MVAGILPVSFFEQMAVFGQSTESSCSDNCQVTENLWRAFLFSKPFIGIVCVAS
jgi:hypothetical protein